MASKPDKVQRSWVPQRAAFEREKDNSAFYNSWPWRKFAKRFKQNNPLCLSCESNGLIVPAKVVDHIVTINNGGDKLDEGNCQSLCESCHNRKSSHESRAGGMG